MSLFGPTQDELQAARYQQMDKSASNYAGMNPFQKADYLLYKGGSGLGQAAGGMMGMVDPQMQRAQQMQSVRQGASSTDEGLLALAAKFDAAGMPEKGMEIRKVLQDRIKEAQALALSKAHAKYYERPPISRGQPANQQEAVAMQRAMLKAIEEAERGGLVGMDRDDHITKRVNEAQALFRSSMGQLTAQPSVLPAAQPTLTPVDQMPIETAPMLNKQAMAGAVAGARNAATDPNSYKEWERTGKLVPYDVFLKEKKAAKELTDSDKIRQFRFAQSPEGGSYKGSMSDFVALSAATAAAAAAPLRAAQTTDIVEKGDYTRPTLKRFSAVGSDGKSYSFPSQRAADNFKAASGGK